MATTSIVYPGLTGVQSTFSIPFEYLARHHVKVTLDGEPLETGVSFSGSFMLSITPAPVGDLRIYRQTPSEGTINDFQDGSVLLADELNASFIQSIFISQEVQGDLPGKTPEGNWDMDGLRLSNVGTPVDPTDAVTKGYLEDTYHSGVDAGEAAAAAAASAAAAAVSKTAAEAAQTGAQSAKNAAEDARDAAGVSETNAAASAAAALAYRNTAELHKNAAAQSATDADADRIAAQSAKVAAEDAQSAAAASATLAAGSASSASATVSSALSSVGLTAGNRAVTAQNLRTPTTGISTPLAHFERSIPLNAWEEGVFGHDTNPANETAAAQALINKAVAQKRDIAWPATKYKFDTVSLSGIYALRMFGVGGKPFFLPGDTLLASGGDLFAFRRPNGAGYVYLGTAAEPSSDIIINEDALTFGADVNPGVGAYIGWTSNREWYYDGRGQWWKGEFHEVAASSAGGTTMRFKDCTQDAYDVSAETLTVASWIPSRLELFNLGFGDETASTPPAQDLTALSFNRCKRAILDDIETYNFSGPHISQRQNDGTTAHNIRCWGGGTADEIGYGLANLAIINSIYTDIQGGGMRRLIDFSGTGTEGCGPSRNCIVDGFHAHGGGRDAANVFYEPHGTKPSFGVGSHGPAEKITFKNGKIGNVGSGVTVRGRDTRIENVEFYGWISSECVYATYGEGLRVIDCSYTSNDYGQKDAQGVTNSSGRRCPTFIRFGNSNVANTDAEYAFKFGNTPVVITGNTYDGLTDDFVAFMPSQATKSPTYVTMVGNKGLISDSSGDFYTIRNNTGGNLVFSASEVWGNDILPRGDSDIGGNHDDGTVIMGGRLSGSLSQDRVSKVGPKTWRIYMGGTDNSDNYVRIKDFAPYGASDASVRISVTGHNGNDTINFDGWIKENSATPIVIYQGANIAFSATPSNLDGDGGTPGKVTLGLTPGGTLMAENRMGATRVFDITVH